MKHKGFTIVELLIVIVVIAILAAISIVAFNGVQNRAKNSQIQSAATAYMKALQLYKADNGQFPIAAEIGNSSYACFGDYSDDICANIAGATTNTAFNSLLAKYVGSNPQSQLPEEYVFTNNHNNWWRGAFYRTVNGGEVWFVQYRSSSCPSLGGSSVTNITYAHDGDLICRASL